MLFEVTGKKIIGNFFMRSRILDAPKRRQDFRLVCESELCAFAPLREKKQKNLFEFFLTQRHGVAKVTAEYS